MTQCSGCNSEKPYFCRNFCRNCYQRLIANPKWRLAHLEQERQRSRVYHAAHREEERLAAIARYRANPDQKKEWSRRWYQTNRERRRETAKAWEKANPERMKFLHNRKMHLRKQRIASLPHTLTLEEWQAIQWAYGNRCAYCGRIDRPLCRDHVIPVSKGGAYTMANIVSACRSCNSKKRDGAPLRQVKVMLL